MNQHEATAADIAGIEKGDGERESGGNGCVNSIAATLQDVFGYLRCVGIGNRNGCFADHFRWSNNSLPGRFRLRRASEQCQQGQCENETSVKRIQVE